LFATLGLVIPCATWAASVDRGKVRTANQRFEKGDYKDAFRLYRQALGDTTRATPDAQGVYYNGGNALYMQKDFDRALDYYQRSYSADSTLTGRMLYNRGNALLKGGHVGEAVESYLQALQYLPDDEDARHNLELALAARERQQQQQQQQQSGQQGSDSNQQQKPSEGQQSQSPDSTSTHPNDPQEGEDDARERQEQQQQQSPSQADSTRQEPQSDSTSTAPPTQEEMGQLSPEDAARILQALQDREQEVQRERRKAAFRRTKRSGKDW
jgi:tetratricopeptide (TPR) repeat protein